MKEKVTGMFRRNKTAVIAGAAVSSVFVAQAVMAIAAPAAGTLGYDLYDVAVNDMLNGPVGFVGGLGAVLYGATQIAKSWMIAGLSVLGGSAVINADTIVASLGLIV